MNAKFDKKSLKAEGLKVNDFICLLSLYNEVESCDTSAIKRLRYAGFIKNNALTVDGVEKIKSVMARIKNTTPSDELLDKLVIPYRELFPQGQKKYVLNGSLGRHPWRSAIPILRNKFRRFIAEFGFDVSDEEKFNKFKNDCLRVTKKVWDTNVGDPALIPAADYFICKEVNGELQSKLLESLENEDSIGDDVDQPIINIWED